jgi:protein TonB
LFVPPPEVRVAPRPKPKAPVVVTTVKSPEPTPPVATAPAAPAPVVAAPPRAPVRVQPRLDLARSREPEYPSTSRRLGEQGSLIVQVLVEPDGRPSDVKLIESSGFSRLDQAALTGIRSSYRFLPGTVDGTPAPQWFTFKFVWKIK